VIIASYIRIYFGVDFTDESYYVALAYRYVLGDSPFVNELSIVPFAVLTVPFIKLYLWLNGNTDGIILFTRHLYFILTLFLASTVFLVTKKYFPLYLSLLIASICIAFNPYMIPNLSYNSMGVVFLTVGCFLGIGVTLYEHKKTCLFLSGICHGLSVFAYPNLLIPVFVYFSGLFLLNYRNIRPIFCYILGGLIPAFLLFSLIIHSGIDDFLFSLNYAKAIVGIYQSTNTLSPIKLIIEALSWFYYPKAKFVLLLFITPFVFKNFKKNKRLFEILCLTIPFIPLFGLKVGFIESYSALSSRFYMFYLSYGFIYLIFLFFISKRDLLKNREDENKDTLMLYLVWFSCFIAGITMAFASGNGFRNLGVGMLGSGIITIMYGNFFLFDNYHVKKTNIIQVLFTSIIILFCVFFQYSGFSQQKTIYRDGNITQLTKQVDFGPFKGIYTTPEKNEYFHQLYQDVKLLEIKNSRILIYKTNLPAIYLLTSMRPASRVTFIPTKANYSKIIKENEYLCENQEQPIIAVKVNQVLNWKLEGNSEESIDDALNNLIKKSISKTLIERDNYTIYLIDKLKC
jgi:hypothetical protein